MEMEMEMENGKWKMENGKWKMEMEDIYIFQFPIPQGNIIKLRIFSERGK
jgi:hypothetical protein